MDKSKTIKIEWCENFIKKTFQKFRNAELIQKYGDVGIECNLFWKMAENSGLWVRGTYGSPMSKALAKLTRVETVTKDGQFCYNTFKLL